jgi:glycosyltransferase involved in cell wall biosynthesis
VRVAVLWTCLSGYLNACLKELASRPDVDLFVAHSEINSEAPYNVELFEWMKKRVTWRDEADFGRLQAELTEFNPEVVVVAGWHAPIYRRIMRPLKGRCLRLMTMDNRWNGTLKQRLGAVVSPFHVLPLTDAAWVPGYHQTNFARRLGFPVRRILHGSLSCDHPAFAAIHDKRIAEGRPLPHAFIFAGRLVESKGIATLAGAYEKYRGMTTDPWPLIVCGAGPLESLLTNRPGVEVRGFVQPSDLPHLMGQAGCLLIPSTFEPWALVVNEATAAGLLIVSTDKVGAVPHLVQNYYNGFVISAGDDAGLAESMFRVSNMSAPRRERMSEASHDLSWQYTPARWADALLDFAADSSIGQL